MQNWLRPGALCFSAGSVGALAKTGAVWACGRFAVTAGFAAHLANAQYPSTFYARIVWGGIAAFLFLLPLVRHSWAGRGLLCGVIVAALQVIGVPLLVHGSVHLAPMWLLSILVLSCIWGLVTAAALRACGA